MSQCSKLVYAELTADRDFAIFKVDSAPQAAISVALESGRTAPNTKITIFGYPMGRPLEWSQYCSVTKSSVVGKPFNSPARVAYQCDTQPGNSGSSVIAVNSNGQPKVIGVHDADKVTVDVSDGETGGLGSPAQCLQSWLPGRW
jgi:hypothetical protein